MSATEKHGYKRKAYRLLQVPRVISAKASWLRDRGVSSVLDLGCGRGRISLYLARRGFSVTAVDTSEAAISALRDRAIRLTNLRALKRDMRTALPGLKSFDLVVAWRVIHIGRAKQRAKMQRLIANKTAPGGFALVAAAADDCPTLKARFAGKCGAQVEPNTITYQSYGATHTKHYYSLAELTSKGTFGELKVHATGKLVEQSGHPEERGRRHYWWVLLRRPGPKKVSANSSGAR